MKEIANSSAFAYQTHRVTAMPNRKSNSGAAAQANGRYRIARRGRCWEVRDAAGDLVCLTVYKKGAVEVVRRLSTPSC